MSSPDWDALVGAWVEEGILTDAQRDPLLERLKGVELERPNLFGEAAVMALVMVGMLLVTSSLLVALALVGADEDRVSIAMVVIGGLQVGVGLPARFFLHRAVGHGVAASGIVVYAGGWLGLGLIDGSKEPLAILFVFLGWLVVSVAAVLDRGPGLAGAAGFAVLFPGLTQVLDSELFTFVLCLAFTIAVAASTTLTQRMKLPIDAGVLGVQTPFAATLAAVAALAHDRFLFTFTYGYEWEAALLLGLYGGVALIGGWVSGARFTLVSGLAVLLVAQAPVLWAFGSAELGIVVLGLEGFALIGAAVLSLVVRARRAQLAADPP